MALNYLGSLSSWNPVSDEWEMWYRYQCITTTSSWCSYYLHRHYLWMSQFSSHRGSHPCCAMVSGGSLSKAATRDKGGQGGFTERKVFEKWVEHGDSPQVSLMSVCLICWIASNFQQKSESISPLDMQDISSLYNKFCQPAIILDLHFASNFLDRKLLTLMVPLLHLRRSSGVRCWRCGWGWCLVYFKSLISCWMFVERTLHMGHFYLQMLLWPQR